MNEYERKAFEYLIFRFYRFATVKQRSQCRELIESEKDCLFGVIACMESQSIINNEEFERLLNIIHEP